MGRWVSIRRGPRRGYRRIHALLCRQQREEGGAAVNVKRVYRMMKAHGLLLERHTAPGIAGCRAKTKSRAQSPNPTTLRKQGYCPDAE